MAKLFLVFVALACLGGCGRRVVEDELVQDQCIRVELFKDCLSRVPTGPVVTHDNPWDQVITECSKAVTYLSYRKKSQIKPECQGG